MGRAGRFGTKGLAITFVSSASDSDILNQVRIFAFCLSPLLNFYTWVPVLTLVDMIQVQARFEVDIKELPEQIDTSTYSMFLIFIFSHVISFPVNHAITLMCEDGCALGLSFLGQTPDNIFIHFKFSRCFFYQNCNLIKCLEAFTTGLRMLFLVF